jgi:hypothetical protein
VADIGLNRKGFLFRPGFTSQGMTVENLMLFSFYKGDFKNMLIVKNAYMDNSGNCDENVKNDCWQYDCSVNFSKSEKDYYDVEITEKGTIKKNGKLDKVDSKQGYSFIDGIYKKKN